MNNIKRKHLQIIGMLREKRLESRRNCQILRIMYSPKTEQGGSRKSDQAIMRKEIKTVIKYFIKNKYPGVREIAQQ